MQESGKLHMLKTRWWKEKRGGGKCLVNIFSIFFCWSYSHLLSANVLVLKNSINKCWSMILFWQDQKFYPTSLIFLWKNILKLLCDQLWTIKPFSNFAERRRPNKQSKRAEPGQRWRRVRRLTGRNGIGLPHRSLRVHLEIKTTGYKRSCKIKTTNHQLSYKIERFI